VVAGLDGTNFNIWDLCIIYFDNDSFDINDFNNYKNKI